VTNRQHAVPLIIRGLTSQKSDGETSHLRRISSRATRRNQHPVFEEKWFQQLLYKFPSLLPVSEIEPAFASLEPIAMEVPVAGKSLDLLFINPDGLIALVETKLFKNPEARREVIAQVIDYACEMSEWNYAQLVQAVKSATKSTGPDPLLRIMRETTQDRPFDENEFKKSVARNLQKGRFLLLIVADEISSESERMVEFIERTPHLHFTFGLVELALFHENEDSIDPLYVQPRILAKTELHPRIVLDITLADGIQMKSHIRQQSPTHTSRTNVTAEEFFRLLKEEAPTASELAEWALSNATEHQLRVDWGATGPSLKYIEETSGEDFNFGQLGKDGSLRTGTLLPRFTRLAFPTDIALDYLDEIIRLVPGSYRKEFPYQHDVKTQAILYGDDGAWLPLEKLAPHRAQWFDAMDKAIQRIRQFRDSN